MLSINLRAQESIALPFFDNFEEPISNDAKFTKWTTENLEGWHYWHIIPGQHMRFEKTDLNQNDWLITKPINCVGAENLKVNFSHLFHGPKVPPKLYYTSQYNGNASQSAWKELTYSFGANENQWYASEDFIIENPGDVIYFAFHYQAAANSGTYFLMDNFSVKSYIPPVPFVLVGNTEHFEYYNNLEGQNDYYLSVKDQLENQYAKLVSIFDRPMSNSVFMHDKKIKVYYSDINDVDQFDENTPVWKSGFYDLNYYSINLSPINNDQKFELYSALNHLAVSELSQLAISRFRGISYLNPNEANFIECFGLYESGFRPDRIKTNISIAELGHTPILDDIRGLDKLTNEIQRNLCVSYAEACILGVSTERIDPYRENLWQDHLYYFYQIDENLALRLAKQTQNFNIFCIPRDYKYIDPIAQQLEQLFIYFTSNYNLNIKHPFNIVIYPDELTGMKFTDREALWYNGGVAMGSDNFNMISPEFLGNGLNEALGGLVAHEFFHVIHFNLLTRGFIPNLRFHMEGSADFNARHSLGLDIRRDRFWMLEWTFNEYAQKYNIELNLEHISSNPNNELDVYYLGDMFYEYLFINHGGYEKIKQFYINGMDYSVFNATYAEIDNGYINYLKSLIENQYNVPIVATKDATSIFANSVLLNGDIASDGGSTITQRGFYWSSTNISPNSEDHVEIVPGTTGSFNKTIENLTAGTIYYFRAFAKNSVGTALGEVKHFTTLKAPELPVTVTKDATNIDKNTAIIHGEITSDGDAEITQRGFYWSSTNISPNSSDHVEIVAGITGSFNKTIENLTAGTIYYFRAFAKNSVGTALGEVKHFTTLKAAELPVTVTKDATNIDKNTAIIHGEITSDGDAEITQRGFYWSSTSISPNSEDHVELVSGTIGSFNKTIENLTAGTIYFFTAFAKNSVGTALGEVKHFTTLKAPELPVTVTKDATNIDKNTAIIHGEITSDGDAEITQRGFYWSSTNISPNSEDHVEIVPGTTGSFNKTIENLTAGTTYYFCAFATNSEGTTKGEVKQFNTLPITVFEKLPFFDDFEETIVNDAIFSKWTTKNLLGWHYWHIIPGGGNGGQCMRFENTDINQNDWLITNAIDCSDKDHLTVNFDVLYHGDGIKPKLFNMSFNAEDNFWSSWSELNYSLGPKENEWHSVDEIIIDNPGDIIYFAFQCEFAANQGIYFLLDNFSITQTITGIGNVNHPDDILKVYPNPMNNKSYVSFTNRYTGNVLVEIFDINGRKLLSLVNKKLTQGTYSYEFERKDLSAGLYIVSLSTPSNQSNIKLIVND